MMWISGNAFHQLGKRIEHRAVYGMCALAAAKHQQRRPRVRQTRRHTEELAPHRNAGHMTIAEVMAGLVRSALQPSRIVGANMRLAKPGTTFGSKANVGTLISAAVSIAGPEA